MGFRPTFAVAALAASLVACGEPSTDAWYDAPAGAATDDAGATSADAWSVAEGKRLDAVAKLETVSFVALENDEASAYAGRELVPAEGSRFYLLRGLRYNPGAFNVTTVGNDVFVRHGSMGHSTPPMTRQPVVADLPRAPEHVYVICSIDE